MATTEPDPPMTDRPPQIPIDDFLAVDIRAGRVVGARPFPEARNPAIRLDIDFGPEIGLKHSSAQITEHYTPEDLVGKLVLAVVNLPPRRIGPVLSEVLVLGLGDASGAIRLAVPEGDVAPGTRLH